MLKRDPNSIVNSQAPLITNPKGLDALVQTLQIGIAQRIGWLDIVYGQAETAGKRKNNSDYIYPQVWQGKGKDMLNVLPNDTLNSYGFFVVRDPEIVDGYDQTVSNRYEAECDFIAWFNLDELDERDIYDHLYREELIIELQNAIQATTLPYQGNISINSIHRKPDAIFEGFTIEWVQNQRLQEPNMGVRINLTISYFNDECGLGAEVPNIVCADAIAKVQDQDGNELANESIPSGEISIITVNTGAGVLYTYPYDSFNTGQDVSYATGDDKWVRDNVFNSEIASWDTALDWVTPRLDQADPTKLLRGSNPDGTGTNIFGNLERFTDENGLQVYANDLAIDHYLGLSIKRTINSSLTWTNAIINANNSTFGAKEDWFVANELMLILLGNNAQNNGSLNYSPFNISTVNLILWTSSTSRDSDTAKTYQTYNLGLDANAILSARPKGNSEIYLIGRKAFTYNPTTKQMELS